MEKIEPQNYLLYRGLIMYDAMPELLKNKKKMVLQKNNTIESNNLYLYTQENYCNKQMYLWNYTYRQTFQHTFKYEQGIEYLKYYGRLLKINGA